MVDVGFSLSQIPLDYYNDSLKFWSDYLGKGERVMVLPYKEELIERQPGERGSDCGGGLISRLLGLTAACQKREDNSFFSLSCRLFVDAEAL